MSSKYRPEPVTIIVSMALTALSVALMGMYVSTWVTILLTFIFFFAGQAAATLYWSLILSLIRDNFDYSKAKIDVNHFIFCYKIIRFYLTIQLKILLLDCTITDIIIFGYLSSFIGFLLFYIGILIKLIYVLFQKINLAFYS
ncbi:hypothetical protein cce_3499 [Crocosphaera subtropica ATCC 51142]|uniref:Uncharacterized protein n=1 Tax=Crocosphaera subtropica (strain ATCC 51142 / BH68) TaxID=43989 RepID=B1WZU8_CROS5|nr:hypothetical protein [Crocosphaera subtropica]ACB52847.1 hypothetical protein cce_3499 [Crocosphaera subtropica ATCC 51142]